MAQVGSGIRETQGTGLSGPVMLLVGLGVLALALVSFFAGAGGVWGAFFLVPVLIVAGLLLLRGLFILQPNDAVVLTLFGKYTGTVRTAGWYWTNPFALRKSISLKINNFNTPQLKVNDADGNPIEIGAVIVWRVVDTARASFDVENYGQFVHVQSETAVRHIASKYPYDIAEHEGQATLRGSHDAVARELMEELQRRLTLAGIEVVDARITHLAYSSEIAGAMLQRQQAGAILAARQRIVEGAVLMVEGVINSLQRKGVLEAMTPQERARMATALLVVLTSDRGAQPIVATTD